MANGTVPATGGGANLVTTTTKIIFATERYGIQRHVNLRLTKYGKIVLLSPDDPSSLPDPSSYDYAINVEKNQMYNAAYIIPYGFRPVIPTYAISPSVDGPTWNGYVAYWSAQPDGTLAVFSSFDGQQEARFSMVWYTDEDETDEEVVIEDG